MKEERSFKNGCQLTEWEDNYLKTLHQCPDCGTGKLLKGPSGGLSTNIKCDNCGSKFNFHGIFTTERISKPCPDKNNHNSQSAYR